MRVLRLAGSLALAAIALGVTLALCEVTARIVDGVPLLPLRLPPAPLAPLAPAKPVERIVDDEALPADVDPTWFDVSPPPTTRGPIDPDFLRKVQALRGTDIPAFNIFRVWNRRFVEKYACTPGSLLQRLPQPLLVFDPPEPSETPPFRYPPSQTISGGLVTNRFGWRGPEIPLDKPAGTIRLAFVGASTTVGLYQLRFSYPEYVVHWLNLWAQRAALPVRFDGINAGREGISSAVIAAVIRQELLPLEPDLVVYYEGANQSLCVQHAPAAPPLQPPSAAWLQMNHIVGAMSDDSQIARRAAGMLQRLAVHDGFEPSKPKLELGWWFPNGLDEAAPDIARLDLPAPERAILADLESARTTLERSGSELALSSFAWLVFDGLRLDTRRHAAIYRHLNEGCWPYRYADLRRAVDLHNHILQRYALAHGLPFVDVAAEFPPDQDLFFDAVHLNDDGTRLHAWIVFRALLPLVRSKIEAGVWPRPDQVPQTDHPSITAGEPYTVSCPTP